MDRCIFWYFYDSVADDGFIPETKSYHYLTKLSPLDEGELKDRLMKLSDKTGFKANSIEVIDGSKGCAFQCLFYRFWAFSDSSI